MIYRKLLALCSLISYGAVIPQQCLTNGKGAEDALSLQLRISHRSQGKVSFDETT